MYPLMVRDLLIGYFGGGSLAREVSISFYSRMAVIASMLKVNLICYGFWPSYR